jgi:hypothetical protein
MRTIRLLDQTIVAFAQGHSSWKIPEGAIILQSSRSIQVGCSDPGQFNAYFAFPAPSAVPCRTIGLDCAPC